MEPSIIDLLDSNDLISVAVSQAVQAIYASQVAARVLTNR